MSTTDIKGLYNYKRFPERPSKIALLVIYVPIGVALFILRTLLALFLYLSSFFLPNVPIFHSVVYKLTHIIFGLIINVQHINRKEDVDALISNKVSLFDSMVINSVAKCVTPGVQFNTFLSSTFGIKYFKTTNNIEEFKKDLSHIIKNKVPILFQPESIITNGKALLKFNIWPFTICDKVQPIAITVSRPGLDIPLSTIDSSYWSDLFFFMFVPCTIYKVTFLPVTEKKGLLEEIFIEKVRQNIADELKVKISNYSATDLKEYVKRYRIEQQGSLPQHASTVTGAVNPEIHRMSMQVREVLPLVPYDAIYKDLMKTRCVDLTITNILEGCVSYVAEQEKPSSSSSSVSPSKAPGNSSSSFTSQSSHPTLNTAASVFGKTPQERSMSFQDRKRLLTENARRRYIEKRGLNIAGS